MSELFLMISFSNVKKKKSTGEEKVIVITVTL